MSGARHRTCSDSHPDRLVFGAVRLLGVAGGAVIALVWAGCGGSGAGRETSISLARAVEAAIERNTAPGLGEPGLRDVSCRPDPGAPSYVLDGVRLFVFACRETSKSGRPEFIDCQAENAKKV